MTTVGIVGVGLLGDAVASRLRAAGHPVVGYDVVAASMDRLAALGGTPARSAGDVARAAEVVCTILPSLANFVFPIHAVGNYPLSLAQTVPARAAPGNALGRKPSLRTSRIIPPPPKNGGIASRRS